MWTRQEVNTRLVVMLHFIVVMIAVITFEPIATSDLEYGSMCRPVNIPITDGTFYRDISTSAVDMSATPVVIH